ncbi:Ctr copper transporter family-domain-containing protein [Hyaloscypha sp. PMI_1271]|nr:Ctr copper transporter family-domain-containing protein [Hyaloscypha sp. PMI_1271]
MQAFTQSTPKKSLILSSKSYRHGTMNSVCDMLLNWHTIDACFLSSAFHIRSSFTFFLSCLAAFLLVISLEFLRRSQRDFDRYLRARNAILQDEEYALPEETEEKLLPNGGSGRESLMSKLKARTPVVLEQLLRGFIHTVQFAVSYCIMLLFMYSNGYIIISILLGSLVGFALFTKDTLNYQQNQIIDIEEQEKSCC